MNDHILLTICLCVSIVVNYNMLKENEYTVKKILQILITCGIICPIIEESFFRCSLNNWIGNLYYSNEINAILFGLLHLTNYYFSNKLVLTIGQFIFTVYFGYVLVQFNNLEMAMLYHCLFNTLSIMITFCLIKLLKSNTFNNNTNNIDNTNNNTNSKYIIIDTLKRSNSDNTLNMSKKKYNSNKLINIKNRPQYLVEMSTKLDNYLDSINIKKLCRTNIKSKQE